MLKKIVFLISCLLLIPTQVEAYEVPPYEGLVNDYAQILSADFEQKLETDLQSVTAASDGAEIAIVTLENLRGETIERVTQDFFDEWQIGKEELDNGVLLLAAMEEHALRIQTGYGAEAVITDAEAGRIIRRQISPEFKAGNYEAGILAGVKAIKEEFAQSPGFTPGVEPLNKSAGFIDKFVQTLVVSLGIIFGIASLVYLVAWLGRSKAWWPGGLVGLGLGLIVGPLTVGLFFGLFGLVLDYILSKNYKKWSSEKKTTDWKKTWGGFHHRSGSSSSSSNSSSSFSFGGGSSGGGGASGGW